MIDKMRGNGIYHPSWLIAIMGEREKSISSHPEAKIVYLLKGEDDGARLPNHQQHIESPIGYFTIDGRLKQIIG